MFLIGHLSAKRWCSCSRGTHGTLADSRTHTITMSCCRCSTGVCPDTTHSLFLLCELLRRVRLHTTCSAFCLSLIAFLPQCLHLIDHQGISVPQCLHLIDHLVKIRARRHIVISSRLNRCSTKSWSRGSHGRLADSPTHITRSCCRSWSRGSHGRLADSPTHITRSCCRSWSRGSRGRLADSPTHITRSCCRWSSR